MLLTYGEILVVVPSYSYIYAKLLLTTTEKMVNCLVISKSARGEEDKIIQSHRTDSED